MSLVRTRIADLEAKSGTFSERSGTSSSKFSPASSAPSKTPAVYHRERLEVPPPIGTPRLSVQNDPDDENRTSGNLPDAVSSQASQATAQPTAVAAAVHQQYEPDEDSNHNHADNLLLAGGYYSKPRKQRAVYDNEGDASRLAAAVATCQRLEAENRSMASKIARLEGALQASQGRIAHLLSSSAKAAENASRRRQENEAAAVMKDAYARRVCQLEDTLVQAEKRANWLQGELEVVWACGSQRVGELECELELARRQHAAKATGEHRSMENESSTENCSTDTSGGSSLSGESSGGGSRRHRVVVEPEEGLNKKMGETQKVISGLRTKFYRVMGEREELQARCEGLEEELLNGVSNSGTALIECSNGHASGGDDEGQRNRPSAVRDCRQTATVSGETKKPSRDSSRGSDKELIKRGDHEVGRDRGRAGSNGGFSTSSATIAVKTAPITTVGDSLTSWHWSPPGSQLSQPFDE